LLFISIQEEAEYDNDGGFEYRLFTVTPSSKKHCSFSPEEDEM
jgi:hypothetical protein